jgi:hypothetical protein
MPQRFFTYERVRQVGGRFRTRIQQVGLTKEEAEDACSVCSGEGAPRISWGTLEELAQLDKGSLDFPETTYSILEDVDRFDGSRRYRIVARGINLEAALNGASTHPTQFVADDFTVESWKVSELIVS